MLQVSIHAGPPRSVSRFNRTDWLDIGYSRLGPMADYKVVLFRRGLGAEAPVTLTDYPRWSASLWDLTARALACALSPAGSAVDHVPAIEPATAKQPCAFAECLTAVIRHVPEDGAGGRLLGQAVVRQTVDRGTVYRANFDEDVGPARQSEPFDFSPAWLSPAELVLRGLLAGLSGSVVSLAPRPALKVPPFFTVNDQRVVRVGDLHEPARTGFLRWLRRRGQSLPSGTVSEDGFAAEADFAHFLAYAI